MKLERHHINHQNSRFLENRKQRKSNDPAPLRPQHVVSKILVGVTAIMYTNIGGICDIIIQRSGSRVEICHAFMILWMNGNLSISFQTSSGTRLTYEPQLTTGEYFKTASEQCLRPPTCCGRLTGRLSLRDGSMPIL